MARFFTLVVTELEACRNFLPCSVMDMRLLLNLSPTVEEAKIGNVPIQILQTKGQKRKIMDRDNMGTGSWKTQFT